MLKHFAAVVLGAASLIVVNLAQAQQPKLAKIGWLGTRSVASGTGLNRLRRELSSLGYIEGKNVTFEFRSADDHIDRLPALADELLELKVHLLVTPSTAEALPARKATRTTPIVCLNVGDAVALGLIESLARPGGNITGVSNIAAVTASMRLELLKETFSKVSRVAVLWYPDDPGSTPQWRESQRAGRELGLNLHSMEVKSADGYERAFNAAIKAGSTALAVTQGPLTISNQNESPHSRSSIAYRP